MQLNKVHIIAVATYSEHIAVPKLVFKMLCRAEALQPAIDHDGKFGAEDLAFLHAVRSKEDRSAGPCDVQNQVP